uniref:Uncharacterized protein n=1 Tax=Salix viminalis TaxID=40686 RepID=A0A6N2KKG1_SALVM
MTRTNREMVQIFLIFSCLCLPPFSSGVGYGAHCL